MKAFLRKLFNQRESDSCAPETVVDSHDDLLRFWKMENPVGNRPEDFLKRSARSIALVRMLSDLPKEARILEVGCNVGRNLAHLHEAGYRNLVGVEISAHAVGVLRETYPQLEQLDVRVGAAEGCLQEFKDKEFDLVFTMAVLEHIHPQAMDVFANIGRIAHSILSIEPKNHSSHRQYPHDVPTIFRAKGFELVSETPMREVSETATDPALKDYFAWRFNRRP